MEDFAARVVGAGMPAGFTPRRQSDKGLKHFIKRSVAPFECECVDRRHAAVSQRGLDWLTDWAMRDPCCCSVPSPPCWCAPADADAVWGKGQDADKDGVPGIHKACQQRAVRAVQGPTCGEGAEKRVGVWTGRTTG